MKPPEAVPAGASIAGLDTKERGALEARQDGSQVVELKLGSLAEEARKKAPRKKTGAGEDAGGEVEGVEGVAKGVEVTRRVEHKLDGAQRSGGAVETGVEAAVIAGLTDDGVEEEAGAAEVAAVGALNVGGGGNLREEGWEGGKSTVIDGVSPRSAGGPGGGHGGGGVLQGRGEIGLYPGPALLPSLQLGTGQLPGLRCMPRLRPAVTVAAARPGPVGGGRARGRGGYGRGLNCKVS